MGHEHNHAHTNNKKILLISFLIITTYMLVEAVGGVLTKSLALLSDAGHMFSDSISLAIALIAFKLGEKAVTYNKTFGYKRFEVLAALFNGVTLVAIALIIFYEAIERFVNPPEVATVGMLIISSIGLAVNILVAWIMMRGADTEENLNMRGAFLHVISDMLGSVGAIIAALFIMFFGWGWADPLASVIVAILVLRSGYFVAKKAIHILMEGTPADVDINQVVQAIAKVEGVKGIHDVHAWTITSGFHAFSCHIVVDEQLTVAESNKITHSIEHLLQHQGIHHIALQMEPANHHHDEAILCTLEAAPEHHH
ncbi:cation diffusion facilitator family transporter [Metasolibacillus sp.]|uniref:cation diffusion facilitator family transporter n=1 Tax=Metasolibacillus sp. TaxID=2703680 RepID=UPI0025FD5A39|nr:cation diffusion facilitator family transporter [Metasolibacillus sp.]MCT6925980.1 cation diffusion facilitator family transporter [Metasolibacillus sp.]MCT6942178.1 cation diffusion facilitator family transporter [Metasolibacillus sp.]